jgi:UDP-N-acetylglucosamine--N-acetylmuramyl-(pentapeptide) pyrophosphoryl-undecaprenol N-acetylglucosamine transferase
MTVAFTGGGTGGHIYPGLAVASALRGLDTSVRLVWIGNREGMDRSIVEAAGLEFHGIPAGKFRRDFSARNLPDALRVLAGFAAARGLLRELKPDLLFSKGGYVSVPPCAAARSLGIPVFTHESDVRPGLATRLNARFAELILLSYAETIESLPPKARTRAEVTGNPVRASILGGRAERGLSFLGFTRKAPLLLLLGGSQGARELNELAASVLPDILPSWNVAHQTGPDHTPCRLDGEGYRAFGYLKDEMPDVLAAADLVLARAGAGTLWESASLGKPLILLPLRSSATRGDQVVNADLFASRGAAVVLPPAPAARAALLEALEALRADPERRAAMGRAAASFALKPAAPLIARRILERLGGSK